MPATFSSDPYAGCNFEVLVTGISDDGRSARGSFAEVSGLGVSIDVIEYRNGSDDITVRKLPGLRKFTNITLKRGIVADLSFWNWMMQSMQGSVQRTSVSVVLLDEDRNEVLRWEFTRAWPCKWFCSGFNAKSSEIAIETLEICHEGMAIDGQAG